jgi:hypothetical protein
MQTLEALPTTLRCTLAVALALTALNCFNDPLTPVAPRWDMNLTVPLSNRTITVQEIIQRDSTILRAGAGNQLTFVSSTTARPTTVNDRISVVPPAASGSVRLGAFIIALPDIVVPLQSSDLPPGASMQVPPMTFDVPDVAGAVNFEVNVRFATGRARLTLANAMDIPVSVVTPIEVTDGTTIQARFVFTGAIPPHGSAWAEDDLAGDVLATGASLQGLHFSTTGSGGATVTIPQTPLTATFTATELTATSGTVSSLPAQRLTDNDVTSLPVRDSTRIQEMLLRSGRLDLFFASRLTVGVRLRFRFPEIIRPGGGAAFEDSVMLSAGGSRAYAVNLAGLSLRSPVPGALLDSLHVVSSVIIPAPIYGTTTLHDTDRVVISMTPGTPLIADSAAVVLKPTWVDVRTVVPLDFAKLPSKFSGQLDIPSATLGLNLTSSVGFPADLYLSISARKATGDSAVLTLPAGQRRILPGTSTITFDDAEVGQFLTQLSARLPDSALIAGRVLINPPDLYNPAPSAVGRIGRNSGVGGVLNVRVPMRLGITDGVYQDTLAWGDEGSGDNVDRGSFDDVNFGTVFAEIQNSMPVQLGLSLQMLDRSRGNLLLIPQSGADMEVASGSVDAAGIVTVPAASSVVIPLSGAEVRQFSPARFVRYALKLNTPAGAGPVSFTTADQVRIKIWVQLSYRVGQ